MCVCACARTHTGFLKADKHAKQCFYDSLFAVIYEPALLQTHQLLCLASYLQNDIISVLRYSAANKKLFSPFFSFTFKISLYLPASFWEIWCEAPYVQWAERMVLHVGLIYLSLDYWFCFCKTKTLLKSYYFLYILNFRKLKTASLILRR